MNAFGRPVLGILNQNSHKMFGALSDKYLNATHIGVLNLPKYLPISYESQLYVTVYAFVCMYCKVIEAWDASDASANSSKE